MDFKNEVITILYGSQTGNAQDVAERIWRESKRYYFSGSVKSIDDYKISNLVNEKCVIFVCSTTGQGEEPDNMKIFWKFMLRRNLPSNALTNLRFAVLGLGDSSYVKFNFAAKRLNKRLTQLGAQMLIPLGLGDDQHDMGYDAAVDPWIESLWKELRVIHPLPNGVTPLESTKFEPRWFVSTSFGENNLKTATQQSMYELPSRTQGEFFVTLEDSIRTTEDGHFQDVRLIKLQTNGEKYLPGDVVVIRPRNSRAKILEFLDVLANSKVDHFPDTVFKIAAKNSEMPVPTALSLEVTFTTLCEEYFDLNAIPRRHVFNILAQLTDSELEKEKCLEFVTAEGQNDLYNYCNRPRRNIVEVLQDFPHATKNITNDIIFEILPPIKPREFSIASSWAFHKDEIHILVAVVRYKTKLVKERMGLCSNYLAELNLGDKIQVWLKNGSFRFPTDKNARVIMVGPGTGMAPFRNYILECVFENSANAGRLTLFFGCRGKAADFHCKEDLLTLHESNKLNLICAFSRDQEHKIYVQHKIVENGELVWENLNSGNAFIYVAGNSKNMPQQVKEAFVEVIEKYGKKSKEEAFKLISQMEQNGQYQTETWS